MLGDHCDDGAYQALVKAVSGRQDPETLLDEHPILRDMLAIAETAVSYEIDFPEVFHSTGDISNRGGFDAVVGNPPWDRMLPADKEFFAGLDLRILDAPTKKEREATQKRLLEVSEVAGRYDRYRQSFRSYESIVDRAFAWQVAEVDGESTIGKQDAYRLFMERSADLLRDGGLVGLVVPSAFHANEGATGIRRLYLERLALKRCYSFENRKKLFDIHASFKFAAIVAQRPGPTTISHCAFYLHDLDWLFKEQDTLQYSLDFVRATGGDYLSLLELRSPADEAVARACFSNGMQFGKFRFLAGIDIGRELNMTDDAWRFTPTADVLAQAEDPRHPEIASRLRALGYLPLHEGKTFHQYDDKWADRPRYLVNLAKLSDRPIWSAGARFYRLAFRSIARSSDERTAIFALAPPGSLFGHSSSVERDADKRPAATALSVLACANSYVFDWNLRVRNAANVSLFILDGCPMAPPPGGEGIAATFLAHSALRLSCTHSGYADLWHEQVGAAWREAGGEAARWPVLESDAARWSVRARIDSVVADAHGLSRGQYAHILSSFSHKSHPRAAEVCLAAFDELHTIGLEAFCRKHDPYWDIPLNEKLPEPVIDLPLPESPDVRRKGPAQGGLFDGAALKAARGSKTRAGKVR